MTNNTKTTTALSTVDRLIGVFRTHMLGRNLPAPAYVQLDVLGWQASVHPHSQRDLASKIANLLMWANTLDDVTAEWRRSKEDWLHITVSGRTHGGLQLEVYQLGKFGDAAGLVHLDRDQAEGVSLDELYALVGLLREAQGRRAAS